MADPKKLAAALVKPNIVQQMNSEYPSLSKYDVQYSNNVGKTVDHMGMPSAGRKLEYYPPTESYNPNKGKPTIQQFAPEMTSKDAFGEIFSHYLPQVDPNFVSGRQAFVNSITPEQKANMLMPDYQQQAGRGLLGKDPSFDKWIENQGGDAFFRGYPTGQYPSNAYTHEQKILLDALVNNLKNGK